MKNAEISRIGEIDCSEHVKSYYVFKDGKLERREVDWHVSRWSTDDHSEHSVQSRIRAWKPLLDNGGTMLGVFDEDKLVGFVIYRRDLTEDTAQLAVLYVSNGYRGSGIGTALTEEVIKLAIADGAKRLYVSATPSVSTVSFYRNRGFELAEEVNKELFELEPEDIHMIMLLKA
ncbi:MAG: GNAT family N-acetyltransferase [Candidatus Zixiibacteriota bacterium]|nr:MAG: GNAT family N-acetyltransferase [candidate division Zixibacteria bacterium]